jgi:hypothetical protein
MFNAAKIIIILETAKKKAQKILRSRMRCFGRRYRLKPSAFLSKPGAF